MIRSGRYVFSSDFLARGYPLDRLAAEKMWRMICLPDETTEQDVARCVFKNTPEFALRPGESEQPGIWASEPVNEANAFPFVIDPNPTTLSDSDSDF